MSLRHVVERIKILGFFFFCIFGLALKCTVVKMQVSAADTDVPVPALLVRHKSLWDCSTAAVHMVVMGVL